MDKMLVYNIQHGSVKNFITEHKLLYPFLIGAVLGPDRNRMSLCKGHHTDLNSLIHRRELIKALTSWLISSGVDSL